MTSFSYRHMRTLLPLSFLLITWSVSAQSDWIRTGITDTILAIHGDGTLIWMATEADGVKSFDPVTGAITTYNQNNTGFPDNDFRSILYFDGDVYAGTYSKGLFQLHDGTWLVNDTLNSPIPGNSVRDIILDSTDNSIWLATDKGLANKNGDAWTIYDSLNSPLEGSFINCLFQSDDGTLWIGTKYAGLTKKSGDTWETYNYFNSGINDNLIRAITQDAEGYLYVANIPGINKYDIAADNWLFVYNPFTVPMTSEKVNRMGFDAYDNFWMATHGGVTRADSTNHFTLYYDYNSNLPNNVCDALYVDNNNTTWVGSYGGLAFFNTTAPIPTTIVRSLEVFPNPATDVLHIQTTQVFDNPPLIRIADLHGHLLYEENGSAITYGEVTYDIPVSHLPAGVYVVMVISDEALSQDTFVKSSGR